MALDAIAVCALTAQLKAETVSSKIDKIHQPEKDEITIYLRSRQGNARLLISASSANPRVHFLNSAKSNPITAPNFCMLLRKHLTGGKIIDVTQYRFERIMDFHIECYTEMGDLTVKHLIAEIMGRHSNIILTDCEYKILDSIKHIDLLTSSVRQILPGLTYEPVPPQDKLNPLSVTEEQIKKTVFECEAEISPSKFIMTAFDGFSPVNAREISYEALGGDEAKLCSMSENEKNALYLTLVKYFEKIRKGEFSPCIISDKLRPVDFSAFEIRQYGETVQTKICQSISDAVSEFYYTRDSAERKKQKSAGLTRTVTNNIERCVKKISLLNKTLNDAKDRDKHKIYGDLINANLYRIETGAKYAEVENFYSESMEKVRISLDEALSPQANAQRYYKKYTKAKVAAVEAKKQLELAEAELKYLESVLSNLSIAENEQDLNALKDELAEGGYIVKKGSGKRKMQTKSAPLHFVSSDGFDIYVGKNNVQNDTLTLKFANSSDLWFHTKNFAGSHTVIKFGIDKNVTERTVFEAATLAATYSSAKSSSNVPVDCTEIKNVKKPNGAKPGMVIYENYRTLYVDPDEEMAKKLMCE